MRECLSAGVVHYGRTTPALHSRTFKFTCTSYTKRHDHAHPSSARVRDRARDRRKDMVGLPIYTAQKQTTIDDFFQA